MIVFILNCIFVFSGLNPFFHWFDFQYTNIQFRIVSPHLHVGDHSLRWKNGYLRKNKSCSFFVTFFAALVDHKIQGPLMSAKQQMGTAFFFPFLPCILTIFTFRLRKYDSALLRFLLCKWECLANHSCVVLKNCHLTTQTDFFIFFEE